MDTSKHSREALRHPERRSHPARPGPALNPAARRDSSLTAATGHPLPPRVPLAGWMSFAAFALSLPASGPSHRTLGAGRPSHRPASDAFPPTTKTKNNKSAGARVCDPQDHRQAETARSKYQRRVKPGPSCGSQSRAPEPGPALTHSLTHQLINCFLTPKALLCAQGQPAVPTIPALHTPQRPRATIVLPTSYVADPGRAPLSSLQQT
jgi:hypothetical protein